MRYLKKLFFVLMMFAIGCKPNAESNQSSLQEQKILANNLKTIIDNYINENPLQSTRIMGKSSMESGFSYPSYHLFFNKIGKDTILSIALFPNYNNFELDGVSNDDNETTYKSIEHKGWIMYKEKYPLIIFDYSDYSSRFIESQKLIDKIPDSLKTGENNQHIKFIKWDYKIHSNDFERIE